MFKSIEKRGKKNYTLNFFIFSGFGFVNFKNEAIFMVPNLDLEHQDHWEMKFFNIDEEAKRFATKENTINIFLFNATRQNIDHNI